MGAGEPCFPRAHSHPPSIPLARWSFLAPGSVEGQADGFLWEGEAEVEAEVEQWGVLGSGVQVQCAPAVAHREGRRDPMDHPASAAALRSFVPPPRRGLPRVPFPARDGIDSQSQRGLGKGAGLNGNQIGNGSPGGRWAGWSAGEGVMRVRWS